MTVAASAPRRPAIQRRLLLRLKLLHLCLWSERLVSGATRGLCFGLAMSIGGAIALVMQSGVVDRENLAGVVLAGLGLGGLCAVLWPFSSSSAARVVDSRWGLEARLGTALELLQARAAGRLPEAQLADTAARLHTRRCYWLPFQAAWRESLIAAAMALLLLGLLQIEGRGASLLVDLPVRREAAAQPGERETLSEPAALSGAVRAPSQGSEKTSTAIRTLDELRRAREAGTLSGEQAARVLDQVESELNQRSSETRTQRETLDKLARALSQVSASEAAAESIQRGDYAQAGQELGQLGQESDQLSPEAKSQLSQALRRAAAESAANPALAERERRAADALAGRDYQSARSTLGALGEQVARAAGQLASQAELGSAMQRLEEERKASAAPGHNGDRARIGASSGASSGQSGGSQPGQGEGRGLGNGGLESESGAASQNTQPSSPEGPSEKSGRTDLAPSAPRLDVAGKRVDIPVRPGSGSERGTRADQAGDDEQLVDESRTTFDSAQLASPVQAGGQTERILVPGDQRQVVRDYFGKRTARPSP